MKSVIEKCLEFRLSNTRELWAQWHFRCLTVFAFWQELLKICLTRRVILFTPCTAEIQV